MDTLLIELRNTKAYKLLQDMEDLDLIRVIKSPSKISLLRQRIQTRLNNEQIDQQLNSIRQEWQRGI
jgi:hypothetical protein